MVRRFFKVEHPIRISSLLFFFLLFFSRTEAATYYLITSQVANARTAGNWDTDPTGNGAGTNATDFTTAGDVFVVLSSQSATISGGNLQIGSASAAVTLQIDGTISVSTGRSLIIGVSGANSIVIFNRTATTSVSGAGNFTLAAGSTLKTANTNGITGTNASITTTGTNTLPTTSNYEYTGAGTQAISGLPATMVGLTLSGTASITLGANLALTGALTLGAGTTLNLSTFTLGTPTSLVLTCGATSGSVISGTGTMTLGGNITVNSAGTGTDEATVSCPVALGAIRIFTVADDGTAASDLTMSGVLSTNAAGVTKAGAGTMVMTGTNTFRAAVTINEGVLSVNRVTIPNTAGPLGTGQTTSTISIAGGATLRYTGSGHTTNRTIALTGTGAIIDASGTGTLTLSGSITGNTFGLILTGTGNGTKTTNAIATTTGTLTKQGSGTWTLSVANSYTGLTTVSAGSLTYGVNSAISTGGITVDGATAILNLSTFTESAGTITLDNGGTISGSGTLTTTGTFELKSGTVSAVLAGSGRPLNKTTSGTVTLSGTNTFTGAVTISAGVLSVNAVQNASTNSPLGTGAGTPAITIGATGTLRYTGSGHSTTRAIVLSGSGATIDASGSGTLTLSGGITGATLGLVLTGTGNGIQNTAAIGTTSGTLTKTGSGTWTLSFANTYTGTTTVMAGTLKAGVATSAFGVGSAVTMADATGAILDITGFANTIGSLTGGGTNGGNITLGAATLTIGSNNSSPAAYAGIISGSGGGIIKTGTGALTLSGVNTYTGGTNLTAGILNINNASALGASGTFTITGGSIDNTSGADITTNNYLCAFNGDFTYSGTIPRNLNLGTGTVTMNASRQITVTAGTLTLGGVLNDNTKNLTKAGAGTLSFGSQAVTLNDVTVSAGTLVSTSGTLGILGTLSSSGTFTHNNGTVNYNKSGAQNIAGVAYNNLTCSNTGIKTISDNASVAGALTVASSTFLDTDDKLTLLSTAAGTARVAQGSGNNYVDGNVTVQRYIPETARRWRFCGSPVSGSTFNDLKDDIFITGVGTGFDATASNYSSVYSYNEGATGDLSNGWTACTNTGDAITVGKGYRIFIRGDRNPGRLDGTVMTQNEVTVDLMGPLNMGDIPIAVSFSPSNGAADDGWNLVANPYASPIDWNAIHDAGRTGSDPDFSGTDYAHLNQTAYIYDAANNSYTSYNALSGMGTGTLHSSGGIIPSGAAFWVKAEAASPLLTIKETYKTVSTPAPVFKAANQFSIKLVMDSITSDEAAFKYLQEATEGYDAYDISKLYGPDVNIASITKNGSFLSANCKPFNGNSDTIPLSLGFANSGSYKMEFKHPESMGLSPDMGFYLLDLFAKQITNLYTSAGYSFTVDKNNPATYGNDRFMLVVGDITTAIPEFSGMSDTQRFYLYPNTTKGKVTVYSGKAISSNANIVISDLSGRVIKRYHNAEWIDNKLEADLGSFQVGLYFITIISDGQKMHTLRCIKE